MGKRDRRRKRQQGKQPAVKQQAPACEPPPPERVLLPAADAPLLELHFNDGVTEDAKALCRAYWEFTQPGAWARNVAQIGQTTFVSQTVRTSCTVSLLTVLCPSCTMPVTVTSRSEMTATRLWNDEFPLEPVPARAVCQDCRTTAQVQAAAEKALEQERAAAANKRKVDSASAWLGRSLHADEPLTYPTPHQALGLLSLAEIILRNDLQSFGPLKAVEYTITASSSTDIELFRDMFQAHWIAATTPATVDCFSYDEDDQAETMYVSAVCWTFPRWLGPTTREAATAAVDQLSKYLADHTDAVCAAVQSLEAGMAVDYLNGLLTDRYGELPIPEHRLPDAYEHALGALQSGYALEQVVYMAWMAAAASVAWGQRTRGLKPGAVSSASVTNLERRIGFAKDRPMQHYDVPNSVPRPAMHSTAVRFLEERREIDAALARFNALHQRINSRDAMDLDHDPDDAPGDGWVRFDSGKWLEDLTEGKETPDTTPVVIFAAVTPTGDLAIQTATEQRMRYEVGGMPEGLPLDGSATLDALVPIFEDHKTHKPNPVATRMIELLGGGFGIVNGTVVFFQTSVGSRHPRDLDGDHQELLRAAHAAAKATVDG
ncbi:hypothetical protein ACFCWY_19970 [Streptomyces sp. NPDC056362]|uniref:hypothetical protein n=1 Tax=unclassified Streptomyces TaxID=2593676 RepID=UPI0035DC6C07